MFRKYHFFLLILPLSAIFCFTNTFAEENGEPINLIDIERIIADGNVEFPTAEGANYIQGNAEYQRAPDFILGDPDFEKMRDLPIDSQDYQLGRQVGMIVTLSRTRDAFYFCTGFLVGPDLFMTNHHCLHDEEGLLPIEGILIFMDYYQDEADDNTLGGLTALVSEVVRADALKDYALLRLNVPIGYIYGWLELDTTTAADTSQSVKIIQHPEGRSKEIVRRNSQIVDVPSLRADFPFLLTYLADTESGSSGSPVFLKDGTGVIGIHHSGYSSRRTDEPLFNAGSSMSHIVPEIQQYLPEPPVYMYWTDSTTDVIQRANFDGSNIEALITTGLRTPTDIALDPYDPHLGKMYWTDSTTDKIQRANLDGSNIQDLVTIGLSTPTSIALDLVKSKMYWTDAGMDTIQRANLDGSNIEDLVTTGLRTPTDIALDPTAGKMYWTDATTDKIQRANLDGSNIEDLIPTGLRTPTGIALTIPQIASTDPPPDLPPGPGPGSDPGSVDVDGDGQVTVVDLSIVALFYGTRVPAGVDIPADVNADGSVDLSDLIAVAQAIDAAGTGGDLSTDDVAAVLESIEEIEATPEAPARFSTSQHARLSGGVSYRNVAAALKDAKHLATDDARLRKWMPMLKELLHLLTEMREIPETTALLPNYPNPFNPETWIPYHLAKPADVSLTIYDVQGVAVRALTLGHQAAGIYESRTRAAYWDGRNASGEPVASGVYFYTLTAGEFTATRKLLIIK